MILEKVRMDSGVKKDYLENTLVFIKVIETSEYKYMGKTDPLLGEVVERGWAWGTDHCKPVV